MAGLSVGTASAQVTPAAGYTPPDDTPVIRVGTTIFANYTYQTSPDGTDADGNTYSPNSFDVARAYINITGNVSHIVNFRVTPDVLRETACVAATCTTNGSLVLRTKYAFVQTNFDDWMTRGSWARFGIQQTPYIDSLEAIYRYRFQGTTFIERIGKQSSADAGASFHYNFSHNYGDVHAGFYNGENYNKAEVNGQKAFKIRGSVRPFATGNLNLRTLRLTAYLDSDHYIKDGDRQRFVFNATYEHPKLNIGYEYIDAADQTSGKPGTAKVDSSGYSIWLTPKPGTGSVGLEGLIRYDHFTSNKDLDQRQNRLIVGAAYWFPHPGGAPTTCMMIDYDGQDFDNITATKPIKAVAVHFLVNY
jgi:hypothetical protein